MDIIVNKKHKGKFNRNRQSFTTPKIEKALAEIENDKTLKDKPNFAPVLNVKNKKTSSRNKALVIGIVSILVLILVAVFVIIPNFTPKEDEIVDTSGWPAVTTEKFLTAAQNKILKNGGILSLDNITSGNGLVFPKVIDGSLNLTKLSSPDGLVLPETIKGNLDLPLITSAKGLKLPKNIGSCLYLDKLNTTDGLVLPETIGDCLFLGSLNSIDGLVLPEKVGGNIHITNLDQTSLDTIRKKYPKFKIINDL